MAGRPCYQACTYLTVCTGVTGTAAAWFYITDKGYRICRCLVVQRNCDESVLAVRFVPMGWAFGLEPTASGLKPERG